MSIAPANAAPAKTTTSSTGAPTMAAYNVARGRTIPVYINNHGSKIVAKSSTLSRAGHRVTDWSPAPGTYKVTSQIKYRSDITTRTRTWHADVECYGDWDENGDWDPNLDCEDYGWWTW